MLIPYEEQWVPYSTVLNRDLLDYQKQNLSCLSLQNSLNNPICFLYDKDIIKACEYLNKYTSFLKIEDVEKSFCGEVYFTNKIEGANTTIARTIAIHNGSPLDKNNYKSEKMIKNCFDATKYLNLVQDINEINLIKLWNIITSDVCENEEIKGEKYRSGNVLAGNYEAPSFNDIPGLMEEWIKFYNSDELDNEPFLKAVILHYTFETIHPFCDGNGRTGRLLMNHYLITHGYEQIKAVSFSHEIDKRRIDYDAAFTNSEMTPNNDITSFLKYMLVNIMPTVIDNLLQEQINKGIIKIDELEK